MHWLVRLLGVYNNNWIRVKENNLLDPDPRGTEFNDSGGNPDTGKIQAIPSDGDRYDPQDGFPANFSTNVHPGDAFNYLRGIAKVGRRCG